MIVTHYLSQGEDIDPPSRVVHWPPFFLYSPGCMEGAFLELRHDRVLGSSALPVCSGAHTALEHILFASTGVCCSRYVAN